MNYQLKLDFYCSDEQIEELENLKNTIIDLETKIDILTSTLSETKADIKYLLKNGESIYIRNKYIRSDK